MGHLADRAAKVRANKARAAARQGQPHDEFSDPALREDVEQDWSEMTVAELKDHLRARDLPVSGSKADLIARLEG